jgi:hypothetical protein
MAAVRIGRARLVVAVVVLLVLVLGALRVLRRLRL